MRTHPTVGHRTFSRRAFHRSLAYSIKPLEDRLQCSRATSDDNTYSLGLRAVPTSPRSVLHNQHHERPQNLSLVAGAAVVPALQNVLQLASVAAPPLGTQHHISFFKFLLIFTAGGLFFSTAVAAVTASYAIGMDNVRRLWEVLMLIVGQVWETFVLGLGLARKALLVVEEELLPGDTSFIKKLSPDATEQTKRKGWKWRNAWKVLKEQLGETRRTAAEGVQALRQEAKMYAGAVGQPGLIPLQYVVDRLMPYSLSTVLRESIQKALLEFPKTNTIKKLTLSSFTEGEKPPILEADRVYDVKNCIAFDYSVKWNSQMEATVQLYTAGGLARVPVRIQNFSFQGPVRVILTPLVDTPPGYGAILLSLPSPPKINLDLNILGGELTKLPFLRREVTSAMREAIDKELLWPRRVVNPMTFPNSNRPILSQSVLADLCESDPLLAAEKELAEQPMLKERYDGHKKMVDDKELVLGVKEEKDDADEEELQKLKSADIGHIQNGFMMERLQGLFSGGRKQEPTRSEVPGI